jgi:hypothetical protein
MTPIPPSWGTGGLTDKNGRLDRPVGWNEWRVPEVTHEGKNLVWSPGGTFTNAQPSSSLLESFVRLVDAPDGSIVRYAMRWGVFGVCQHGLPACHNPPPVPIPIGPLKDPPWCSPRGYWEGRAWEPLEIWRGYARKFRALLNLAARAYGGSPGNVDDWRELNVETSDTGSRASRLAQDRVQLSVVVNQLVAQARVTMDFRWDRATPVLHPTGRGLFGALVIQLALAIGRSDGLAICSACSVSYIPPRRPRLRQRRYCQDCRDRKVPQRDAAASYRSRRHR